MRITLVATGGTIASRSTHAGVAANVTGRQLLDTLDAGRLPPGADITVVDVGTRGSYALTLDDMHTIARAALAACADGADGVVLTHGTDSLEETAYLTDLLHEGNAPIVVTGAQRPFDDPAGDGKDNLEFALACAASAQLRGRGVVVAFNGAVLPACGVRKVDTTGLAAFANVWRPDPEVAPRACLPGAERALSGISLPPVAVVATVPGGTGQGLRDAVSHGPAGIVLQAVGIGNASPEDAAAVADVVTAGVPVLVTTRVQQGVVRAVYSGGKSLEEAGAVFAGHLSTWQARVLLSLVRAVTPDGDVGAIVTRWLAEVDPSAAPPL